MPDHSPNLNGNATGRVREVSYWRVEGSLFEISALRSVGFFNWNSQSYLDRWIRRSGMTAVALLRPPAYLASRTLSTRFLHSVLRGITRDRLDLLGEEYFQYVLKPAMRQEAVRKAGGCRAQRRARRAGRTASGTHFAAHGGIFQCARLHRQPPGVPRRRGHGTFARAGDPAARPVCVAGQRFGGRAPPKGQAALATGLEENARAAGNQPCSPWRVRSRQWGGRWNCSAIRRMSIG